jgi:hypothetical protein
MKYFYSTVLLFFFISCQNKSATEVASIKYDSVRQQEDSISTLESPEVESFYFVVIADTGKSYAELQKKMMRWSSRLSIPVDTMGRTYNWRKDLIALPEDDEDEIYAGEYYPRRFPSEHFSLEYLDFYTSEIPQKTIALVAGLYESKTRADSALIALKKVAPKAFVHESVIFTGCMH